MTKTLRKNIKRCITGSLGRYVAILLIIALGVAFLTGLKITRPVMIDTAQAYLNETKLFDLRLISTIGFDADDVDAVRAVDGVAAAEGSVSTDFVWLRDGQEVALKAMQLTETVNTPALVAGTLPRASHECALDALHFGEDLLGQTITVDTFSGDESLFSHTEYTVTALVRSPLYLDMERGTTSLADGSLDGFVLIPAAGFDSEYFTELYVRGAEDFPLYSADYDAFADALADAVEIDVKVSVQARFDGIVADAEAEIADAEAEFEEEKAKAEAELLDAKQQLEDAALELEDGRAELRDAWAQLEDARKEIDEGAALLQADFTSWEGAIAHAREQYEDGKAQLDAAYAENMPLLEESKLQLEAQEALYQSSIADLEAGQKELDAAVAELDAGQAQYEAGLQAYNQNYAAYEAAVLAYNQNYAAYETGLAQYEAGLEAFNAIKDTLPPEEAAAQAAVLESTRKELDRTGALLAEGKAQLDQNQALLVQGKAQLDATHATLQAGRTELEAVQKELDIAAEQLSKMRALLNAGWNDYWDGLALFDAQYAALAEADAGIQQFEDGLAAYYDGLDAYTDGVASINDGQKEYEDGLLEYEDGLREFSEEIADAEAEIADAKQEVADLEDPELYVLDRTANTGYVTFENDSMIVSNLSTIFPIFFFLIAALVCSTTMTRMVDDERTQIGTLRALGYSRGSIFTKYMFYAGSAAFLGCLVGYFGGGYLFPKVIWIAYGMLYQIPGFVLHYSFGLFAVSVLASLLCSAGTAYMACRHEMASTPANLIRPKTPPSGKRILLERITPLWKRLKFLYKVSLRNIFRFKKRMFMMILGIAGCTALVLTAFGIRDSVADIADYQYNDIQKYHISATFENTLTAETTDTLEAAFAGRMETDAAVLMASGDLTGTNATKSVYIVAADDPAITEIIDLHLGKETVPFPDQDAVVITEKLARLAGVRLGDTITLSVSDTDKAELTVAGFAENYVQNYVYLTGETYDRAFRDPFEPQTLLLRVTEGTDEYAVATDLMNTDGVVSVSVVSDMRRMISNMMQSLNYVVALVLACAAALAFIVLINLGNINISERVREIATIKVLGFHANETGAYVFRENVMLSVMGIVLGLPLGILLHAFVMDQIQVDMVSFKYVIQPMSYALTVAMVLLFTVLTDLLMRKKITAIDMAESLKSIE